MLTVSCVTEFTVAATLALAFEVELANRCHQARSDLLALVRWCEMLALCRQMHMSSRSGLSKE